MNTVLSSFAWFPLLVIGLAVVWVIAYHRYAFSHPGSMALVGVGLWLYFALHMYLLILLSKIAKCTEVTEAGASGCVLFGRDVSDGIAAALIGGWFGMFIIPAGVILILIAGVSWVYGQFHVG